MYIENTKLFVILLLLLFVTGTYAEEHNPSSKKISLFPLPVLGYTPETDLMLGAAVLGQFKLPASANKTRTSNFVTSVIYTLKKQYIAEFDYSMFSPAESYIWKGSVRFRQFPASFWGIGRNTLQEDEVTVDQSTILFRQRVYKKVGNHFYTGPQFRYIKQFNVSFETADGDPVTFPGLPGNTGHTGIAIGWGAMYDSRNNLLTPSTGSFFELNTLFQHKDAGSTFSFIKLDLDARTYINITNDQNTVLGFNYYSAHTFGDVPFDLRPVLGGMFIMRGLYEGRYRDDHSAAVQAELRRHLFWRIGAVAFLSTGNIGNSLQEIISSDWKVAGGGGIRFNIGKEEKTNIRIDYGFGPKMSGLYISLGEAF